ncbi:MAG: transcriptional regulator, XRE family [uncultured bacterium]|nr:MAG: transcriptional regulator, XRE family [uncultured bacterium]
MKKEMFDELLESVHEGGAMLKGKIKPSRTFDLKNPDVKKIRAKLSLSQCQFAKLMGISIGTLKNWEQGRRYPQGPARVLLGVAATHPQALIETTAFGTQKQGKKAA